MKMGQSSNLWWDRSVGYVFICQLMCLPWCPKKNGCRLSCISRCPTATNVLYPVSCFSFYCFPSSGNPLLVQNGWIKYLFSSFFPFPSVPSRGRKSPQVQNLDCFFPPVMEGQRQGCGKKVLTQQLLWHLHLLGTTTSVLYPPGYFLHECNRRWWLFLICFQDVPGACKLTQAERCFSLLPQRGIVVLDFFHCLGLFLHSSEIFPGAQNLGGWGEGHGYSLWEDCGFETQKDLNYFCGLLLRHLNAVTGLVLHVIWLLFSLFVDLNVKCTGKYEGRPATAKTAIEKKERLPISQDRSIRPLNPSCTACTGKTTISLYEQCTVCVSTSDCY